MPEPASCYNGRMFLYAHGYIAQGSPADTWKSHLILPDGTTVPGLLNRLGFGVAASSFSRDGLAIVEGVEDAKALANVIANLHIPVQRYFIAGVSEGGAVATKSVEAYGLYSGGISVCGPIGSFRDQINYLGDVRVLFDYFFPGVLKTGTSGEDAIHIPDVLRAQWTTLYEPAVRKAVKANPLATLQLLSTANIPVGLNFANAADSITAALWYNVFATEDVKTTLGGNPFDNIGRVYLGSLSNARLNARVARFAADSAALGNLAKYETSGLLPHPLVTLHTTADPVVLFAQEGTVRGERRKQRAVRPNWCRSRACITVTAT